MNVLKLALQVVGVLAILMGLLWIGQGLNLIRWPADSFMIAQPTWSWRGAVLAGIGALILWRARR